MSIPGLTPYHLPLADPPSIVPNVFAQPVYIECTTLNQTQFIEDYPNLGEYSGKIGSLDSPLFHKTGPRTSTVKPISGLENLTYSVSSSTMNQDIKPCDSQTVNTLLNAACLQLNFTDTGIEPTEDFFERENEYICGKRIHRCSEGSWCLSR